ncbi:acyltransferase [Streptomyces sp. KS 21]|uniref:acyltransferase family protein n=1 Tax=Streptomyces sp. KS 21 TaxID=2485150 RepID=UPI001063C401|nr:acyltransferase [Streptomyces sp. KS 21]TDU74962.1 peptidoglycan/LPS O-acetylase OafA/YrhL [Streptomyces sp. KS 21]
MTASVESGRSYDTVQLRVPAVLRQEPQQEPEPEAPSERKGGRDRYFDLLRALALVRVVFYHNFGWFWLPLVFPSMGVMFALAGALMTRSLSRPALGVIRGRLRRLLPPMWLFGAIMITLQTVDGWGPDSEGHPNWWWSKLAFWILPLSTPPYGEELAGFSGLQHHVEQTWAAQVIVPLWYLRAYLWYVLFSPLMLWALRKFPVVTLFTPLAVVIVMNTFFVDQDFLYGRVWETANDFTMFGSCWILGMAHQEGLLKKIPQYVVPSIAPLIMVAGFWYLQSRPVDPTEPTDIEAWPIAQALWSLGFVAILLHVSPSWKQWPRPLERWNGLVSLLNARAVSVYLWHQVALVVAVPLIDPLWGVPFVYRNLQWLLASQWFTLLVAIPLVGLLVLTFGWVEDVAAKRSPRLLPYPRRQRGRRRAAD